MSDQTAEKLSPESKGYLDDAHLVAELRSDHAGETGAVFIYRGILAISREPEVRRFADHHLETEAAHLRLMEELLPPGKRSALLPIWRLAGWLTGALPAMVGSRAVFRTINAVETFVDRHYQQQLDYLDAEGRFADVRAIIHRCQADEIDHRDEARGLAGDAQPHPLMRLWVWMVGSGSAGAVWLARKI